MNQPTTLIKSGSTYQAQLEITADEAGNTDESLVVIPEEYGNFAEPCDQDTAIDLRRHVCNWNYWGVPILDIDIRLLSTPHYRRIWKHNGLNKDIGHLPLFQTLKLACNTNILELTPIIMAKNIDALRLLNKWHADSFEAFLKENGYGCRQLLVNIDNVIAFDHVDCLRVMVEEMKLSCNYRNMLAKACSVASNDCIRYLMPFVPEGNPGGVLNSALEIIIQETAKAEEDYVAKRQQQVEEYIAKRQKIQE